MSEPKFNEHKFEELSINEQRNEILKAIHNRLGEIAALLPYIAKAIAPSYRFNTPCKKSPASIGGEMNCAYLV